MASSLKLVATPLGNIRDISLRAIDELKRADVIFAEDTRHSFRLIEALGIKLKPNCRLVSCNSHSEEQRIKVVSERLLANDQVLFLSDAGCPVISDPGSLLVQGIVALGLTVEIIPGPSAHSAALMGAGIDTTRFAFLGFLPQRKITRKNLIESSAKAALALIFYESPRRIENLLEELHEILGPRRVIVARELTKIYETFHRGYLGEPLNPPIINKGEMVVIVEAKDFDNKIPEIDLINFIKNNLSKNTSAKDIASLLSKNFNIKRNIAYQIVQDNL
jgi:16S rRNA (cytidine1402-2'-O)-methyltransferase